MVIYQTSKESVVWENTISDQTILILFLAAGLLPVYQAVNSIRRAFFYRRQRAAAIALGRAADGRITEVVRQYVSYEDESHRRRVQYRRYYFLRVEVMDPFTGATHMILSQGYRRPVHRYLCSDRVKVYTDQSGWKHYLEDFQWKEHKNDPDIFDYPREFEEVHLESGRLSQIIFVVILLLMILNVFIQR